jgi:hypothetical protein
MAAFAFYNYPLTPAAVAANYNDALDPVGMGVGPVAGAAVVPPLRPTSVALGALESSALYVIEERRDTLDAPLAVDAVVAGATMIQSPTVGGFPHLFAGMDVTSYLMHFDPVGADGGQIAQAEGSVTFGQNIIGLLFDDSLLPASDATLGSIGNYGAAAGRGLAWATGDFIEVSGDQRTLSFRLSTMGDALSQFRVITDPAVIIDPVPNLAADFDGDGAVDAEDLAVWQSAFGLNADGDADADGDSDGADFLVWQRTLGAGSPPPSSSLAADFNNDGMVNGKDLTLWRNSAGRNAGGDADGDGDSDGADFLTWQRQTGNPRADASTAPIPEPSTVTLAIMGVAGLAALALRRRGARPASRVHGD